MKLEKDANSWNEINCGEAQKEYSHNQERNHATKTSVQEISTKVSRRWRDLGVTFHIMVYYY